MFRELEMVQDQVQWLNLYISVSKQMVVERGKSNETQF